MKNYPNQSRATATGSRWAMLARAMALSAMFAGVAAGAGCGDRSDQSARSGSVTELPAVESRELAGAGESEPRAIDEPLMIALAQARNFHHKADIHVREGELELATAAVKEIFAIPFPAGAPEAEDVELDARARLAKLLATRGQVDDALQVVDEGIEGASRESFFLANLYTARGEVYEAMANMLDDQVDEQGEQGTGDDARAKARQARRSAIEAFDRSIEINRALQRALMDEGATDDGATERTEP